MHSRRVRAKSNLALLQRAARKLGNCVAIVMLTQGDHKLQVFIARKSANSYKIDREEYSPK